MKRIPIDPSQKIIEPTGKPLLPVREQTLYPAQFPILLRERLRGQSVSEVAEFLGIKPGDVNRLLAGQWRPSKAILNKLGLKVVYALEK